LKTININLIGDLRKTSKTNPNATKKRSSLDTRNQIYAYILIIGVFIVFTASLGGWFLVKQMTSNLDKKLVKLNEKLSTLKEQEKQLSLFRKNLKKEKEITELKIIIQSQLNNTFFPWSTVLQEIAVKIPKDIIVLKIEKEGKVKKSRKTDDSLKLKISGIISANKQQEPLTAISLFIFNLNDNQDSCLPTTNDVSDNDSSASPSLICRQSTLSNAKIAKLDFNDKTRAYEFEIETSIRSN